MIPYKITLILTEIAETPEQAALEVARYIRDNLGNLVFEVENGTTGEIINIDMSAHDIYADEE